MSSLRIKIFQSQKEVNDFLAREDIEMAAITTAATYTGSYGGVSHLITIVYKDKKI